MDVRVKGQRRRCPCVGKKILLGIALRRIVELEEHSQTVTVNVWMRQYWRDDAMVWDPASELKTMYGDMEVSMSYDGNVTYHYPAVYRITCTIDIAYYPFDQQTCVLTLPAWARSLFLHKMARLVGMSRQITDDEEHNIKLTTHESQIEIVLAKPPISSEATLSSDLSSPSSDSSGLAFRKSDLATPIHIGESGDTTFGHARVHARRSTTVLPMFESMPNNEMLLLRIYRRLEDFRIRLAQKVNG
ncbi:hypothetical protein NP493_126g11049 [Ridgeia piscesae]|uniref:Neurotransmitter-gated ion-channel ligand-binding domain-containing protein n=1 Tax=Ridgeia piscesae TaxID=27915 RepID=A0AAD9UGJ6_RIDPI|nr:hypothetical protein NP493_126g11049 [Ridgeia piscesae]